MCDVAVAPFDVQFNQSIGMVNIPTANILKNGEMRASLNAGVFSLGLFDFFEMGILAFNKDNKFYYGNRLAIKLIEEDGVIPAIAIGGESYTENPQLMDATYFNSYYMVLSHDLGMLGTGHIGAGNGRFIGTGEASSRLNGVFCGVQKTFCEGTPFPLTLKLEEDGRDINFGVMLRILSGFHLVFSVTKLDNVIYAHPEPNDKPEYMFGFLIEGILSPVEKKKGKQI
jgi:hypothetical protein